MTDYKAIFEGIETTLIRVGSGNLDPEIIRKNLAAFKYENRKLTDNEYYQLMVFVIFASGFRASTANERKAVILGHYSDYQVVADYGTAEKKRMMHDVGMIKNEKKINACVDTARKFRDIVTRYGSFEKYIDSFDSPKSFENLMLLKEDLDCRFQGLGGVTAYHFLTDIGLPVIKPDRVLCRIFERLGLIENEKYILRTVFEAKKFAEATGYPLRYIDIVFVAYGQMQSTSFGLTKGICLLENPGCKICGITKFCKYYARINAGGKV